MIKVLEHCVKKVTCPDCEGQIWLNEYKQWNEIDDLSL